MLNRKDSCYESLYPFPHGKQKDSLSILARLCLHDQDKVQCGLMEEAAKFLLHRCTSLNARSTMGDQHHAVKTSEIFD